MFYFVIENNLSQILVHLFPETLPGMVLTGDGFAQLK